MRDFALQRKDWVDKFLAMVKRLAIQRLIGSQQSPPGPPEIKVVLIFFATLRFVSIFLI